MKAVLYGVVERGVAKKRRLTWRISLDFAVDDEYWKITGGIEALLVLQPRMSLGWASMLRQYLTQQSWERLDDPGMIVETLIENMTLGTAERLDGLDTIAEVAEAVLDKLALLRQDRHLSGKWSEPFKVVVQLPSMQTVHEQGMSATHRAKEMERISGQIDSTIYAQLCRMLNGRSLIPDEVIRFLLKQGLATADTDWIRYVQTAIVRNEVLLVNGMNYVLDRPNLFARKAESYRCRRCGSGKEAMHYTHCAACGEWCPYCEECLTMGRIRFCSPLLLGKSRANVSLAREAASESSDAVDLAKWHLSLPQEEAVRIALRFLEAEPFELDKRSQSGDAFLIWAVTGAGKTEMIFPLLDHALRKGGRVLVATPRKDVVRELEPRIAKAFPHVSLIALYGGSGRTWDTGDIVLATTHQLIRFWRYFDLVVIDELDAFPYHNNPMLEYAASKACKSRGRYVLLSATPPEPMQKQVKRGSLPHAKVPVRYHGHPLPVPVRVRADSVRLWLQKKRVPRAVLRYLEASIEREAQVFLFIPRIEWVDPLVNLLRRYLGSVRVEGTSSKDAERADKVQAFRDRVIQVLVTTTILERGVTVRKSDVMIVDSDAPLFDAAALVQMAGRAGRSADDPKGRVYFCSPEWNASQKKAIRQIRSMNRIAAAKGFIKG